MLMEYQEITNASNQPFRFRKENWVETNEESRGRYNVNTQIKFKTTMLNSILCDSSDAYILAKGTITVADTSTAGATANNTNKKKQT